MRHLIKLAGIIAFTAGLGLLVTACGSTPVLEDIPAQVNNALKEARIDHVSPIWDPDRREMKLRGTAIDADEKRQAEEVAANALRERGRIVNEVVITMRGAPEPAPVVAESDDLQQIDDRIQKDVNTLFSDDVWKGREINVIVRTGTVHLTGSALSQADKDRITEAVARVAGVKDVINRLDVKEPRRRG